MSRSINATGLAIIKGAEGLRLEAYRDPVGIWTIGYGHTKDVLPGMTITEAKAEQLLREDVEDAERIAEKTLDGLGATDNQFSACVSLIFNIGGEAWRLKCGVLREMRNGNPLKAATYFEKWNKAKGRVLDGLTVRRKKERDLFLTPDHIPSDSHRPPGQSP